MHKPKTQDGFDVYGISVVTTNAENRASLDINELWQRFYNESVIDRIPDKLGAEVYAVYSDYEGDHTKPYRLTIGCRVTDAAKATSTGLERAHVPAGQYQPFYARGEQPAALIGTWEEIWKSPLVRAFRADYEIYGPRFFEPGLHEVAVHIGIESKGL
jgi:predicted transcriptional regulator YdeE